MAGRLAQLEKPKGRLDLPKKDPNRIVGLLEQARVAQEEAKKANSFGGLLKKTITGLPQGAKKVGTTVGNTVLKPAVNALLVRPAIRTSQVIGTPIAKALGATPEGIAKAQSTPTTINTGLLGKHTVKPATSIKQVTGEGLEAGSYLYTPAKAAQTAVPFLRGVSVPARQAVSNIVRGGLGGYAADVGYGLQDETKTTKQALKPGLGTVLGAGIPAAVAGGQALKESRKLYQSLTPVQRQAGFAKFVPDETPKVRKMTRSKEVPSLEKMAEEARVNPKEYLDNLKTGDESVEQLIRDNGDRVKIEEYKKLFQEGKTPPPLKFTRLTPEESAQYVTKPKILQDGFHRASAAYELGIKDIPIRQKSLESLRNVSTAKPILSSPAKQVSPRVATPRFQKSKLSVVPKAESPAKTVEKSAQESFLKASQGNDIGDVSLTNIIKKEPTPVNKKVGILDYIRTPDRVLKKIGLEKNANEIRVQYNKYLDELPVNIDKITEWSKRVPKESGQRIFKYLDGQPIDVTPQEQQVAGEIKGWLDEWADRLKLPKDKRVTHYITRLFDDQLIKKEFDEDLAKIITNKVPGSVYDPFLLKRLGAQGYKEDVWAALDAYVKRATRKVHMDPALDNLQRASNNLELSQWEYVKKYADRLNLRPTEWDNKFDNSLKQAIGYRFGQRPVANISRNLRQITYRGMLGGNISSALRNLSQGVNTYSKLGERYAATGYMKLVTQGTDELKAQGILRDNFIQDRVLSSTKKFLEKLDRGLFVFFDGAEKINRGAAYYGAKSKALAQGLDETAAIEFAKKVVADTQFLYSNVDTPLMMQGDIAKVFTQFMTYPVKQSEFLIEMAKNKEIAGLLRYAAGGLAFVYTAGKLVNMDPKELIPWTDYLTGERKFGAPPSLKFPVEVGKAVAGTPDEYGNERSTDDKLRDVGKSLMGVVPAGIQIKKTYEGIKSFNQGASVSPSGRVRYPIEKTTTNRLKTGLFGQYSTNEARDYFKQDQMPLSEKQSEYILNAPNQKEAFEQIKKEQAEAKEKELQRENFKTTTYQPVQDLLKNGKMEEADRIVQSLSPEEQELYKSVRTTERSKNTENLHDLLKRDPAEAVRFVRGQNEREKARLVERLNDKDSFTDEERALYVEGKNVIIQ